MKNTSVVILLSVFSGNLYGSTECCDVQISPNNPTSTDVVTVEVSGEWRNSCVPDVLSAWVDGNAVYVEVTWSYIPDICMPVLSWWSLSDDIGSLSPGMYTVYQWPPEEPLASFVVSDKQFVLGTDRLIVPENGSALFSVRLLKDPLEEVEVSVARTSGDEDITVQSGASLTFDSNNYSVAQTVTLAADDDGDYLDGTATISITAAGYLTAELTAVESENDILTVLYVDANATGNNDGTSWVDAFTSLQDALSITASYPNIEEIRAAQGTYKPAGREGDRNASFRLVKGLTIKGGYAGFGERNPDAWNPNTYESILSGDLNGDDVGDFNDPSRSDNSRHVVTGDHLPEKTSVLDGFTITAGNGEKGGGIYIHGGRGPAIRNCVIVGNQASESGGGIHSVASPEINNCILSGNSAGKGGGLYTHAGSPKLINCTLSNNAALVQGGGLYVFGGGGDPALTNCILWGNLDDGGSDESAQAHVNYTYESTTVFNYCCIQDWTGTLTGTGNFGNQPLFADPNTRDYHLKSQGGRWDVNEGRWTIDEVTSPCIDAGDPMTPIGFEPFPNGGVINMGAYGGRAEASKSYFGKGACERVITGDVNGDCIVDFKDFQLIGLHWCEESE